MNMTEEQKQNLLKMIESPNVDDINLAGSIIRHNLNLTDEQLEFLGICGDLLIHNKSVEGNSYFAKPDLVLLLLNSQIKREEPDLYRWKLKGFSATTGVKVTDITKAGELKLNND